MVLITAFSYTKDDRSIDRLPAVLHEEIIGSPKFPQVLDCPFALFFDPGRIDVSDQYETPMLFPLCTKTKTPTINFISGLNSTAFELPVNASPGGLLTHDASLGSGGWSALPGRLVLQGTQ
jgi:hypothetical protein